MEGVVAQLPLSVRCFSFPRQQLRLQLAFKDCYVIRSGDEPHDFTGLRAAWPGAHLLLRFLLHSRADLADLTLCELGAGSGLCGLACALLGSTCALTDRVPAVLNLLRHNVQLNQLTHRASVHQLDWGAAADAQALLQSLPPPHVVHCVIAADVIYPDTSDLSMHRLLDSALTLLQACPPPSSSSSRLQRSLVLSYVNRSSLTSHRFFDVAAARGFHCTPVPAAAFLEEEQTKQESGEEEGGERTLQQEMQGLMGYSVLLLRPHGSSEWRSSEPFVAMTRAEKDIAALSAVAAEDDESTALPLELEPD